MGLFDPVGGFVNTVSGNKAAQEFSSKEAEKQREWEEKMATSAYQNAVKDMKKAGLNPAAMYGGGSAQMAATPSGASASSVGGGQFGNVIGGLANVVNSIGYMTSSMNSKHEMKGKLKAYEHANDILRTARSLAYEISRK